MRRRKAADNPQPGRKQKRKRAKIVSMRVGDAVWEWDSTEEFEIERLIGRMVADGSDVPGRAPGSIGLPRAQCCTECCGLGGRLR